MTIEPERSLEQWIDYAHSLGLCISNLCQLPDGKWRLCMKVFGATPELAQEYAFTDFADRETPNECFKAVFASKNHRDRWEPLGAAAVAAMRSRNCTATLILADRPAVNAARADFLTPNKPNTVDAAERMRRALGD